MASGAPDYYNRTLTNITAQDIGNIAVDIAQQTLSALNIDVAAQSVGNIDVDLNAASVGNLPVDLSAQTVGNIDVDLNASSIGNVPVDIGAASIGNIGIDLAAQSGSDIDIDINAQSIGEIINRPTYGGAANLTSNTVITPGLKATLYSVSGAGMIYGCYVGCIGTVSQKTDIIDFRVDGQSISYNTYDFLQQFNINNATIYPVYSIFFDDTNFLYLMGLKYGITFESSFYLYYTNNSANNIAAKSELIYALI